MGFQTAIIRGLEWAQFATEWLMVSMMGLHMTIQTLKEKDRKGKQKMVNNSNYSFRCKAKHLTAIIN